VIAIRRLYLYLLAFVGLAMWTSGAANLARVVLEVLTAAPVTAGATYVREQVASWGAATLVGVPVWLAHWLLAQRLLAKDPAERESALRRLYLYAVLTVATIAAAYATFEVIDAALDDAWREVVRYLPAVVIGILVWLFTWPTAVASGSGTIRRWYIYGAGTFGLLLMSSGAQVLIREVWLDLASGSRTPMGDGVPDVSVGLALWLVHGIGLARRFAEADRQATLRSVAAFITLAVGIAGSVIGLSQLLYYALARALGVVQPGGVAGSLLEAASGPVSTVLVYGTLWAYARVAANEQARGEEAPRQIGTRRLYTYLVALVAVATLATGIGGVLWVLADALIRPPDTAASDWWRDRVAASTTLTIVGLPLWLLHWRASGTIRPGEAGSLARRLYLYLTLIGASLVLLVSLAMGAYRLLTVVLGAPLTPSLGSEVAHSVANVVVAGVLVAYHVAALRADARMATPALEQGERTQGLEAMLRLRARDGADLDTALGELRRRGYEVEVISEAPPPAHTSPPAG
jgi:hypothetical protein